MKYRKVRLENVLIKESDSAKGNGECAARKVLVIFEKEEILFQLIPEGEGILGAYSASCRTART